MAETSMTVGHFAQQDLQGWENKSFQGNTQYQLIKQANHYVLQAQSHASASGLFHEVDIDLNKTPYLHWSWKIKQTLSHQNERNKAGDDYVARMYVVFSGGFFFWRTRGINYVWSNNQHVGQTWINPYTDHVQMMAVESGNRYAGEWRNESRNIREDYRRFFGQSVDTVDAIAIMTDTDNTKTSAEAWYGDIWMSE